MSGLELLPLDEDREFLEHKGWDVEVKKIPVGDSHEIHIIIHKFPLSSKFNPSEVDLLVRQLSGYPMTQMDMFWTRPDVVYSSSGEKPPATQDHETYQDLQWQKWSRHAPWRAGIDNLETFFITHILRELTVE